MTALTFAATAAAACAVGAAAAWVVASRRAARPTADLSHTQRELTRRLHELFSLHELVYVLADSMRLDRTADQIARYVHRFTTAEGVAVLLGDETGGPLRVIAAANALADTIGTEIDPAADTGLVTRAIAKQTAQIIDGHGTIEALFADRRVGHAIAVPLRARGLSVGAVVAAKDDSTGFSQEEIRLLSTVATHASLALANAALFDLVRRGKEQWESTFDALTEGIAVVDESGRIRRANVPLAQMVGADVTEVAGMPLSDALFGSPAALDHLLNRARQDGAVGTLTHQSGDGRFTLHITAAPLRGGEPRGWAVVLVEDITERRALETQLLQSEKLAAMGQLVSGVAHELNNPLTSIMGLTEFLLEAPATPPREHLAVVHEQAERAARIVRDLLTFARRGPAEAEPVDLNAIAQHVTELMAYEFRLRGIELTMDLAAAVPPVSGTTHELEQVLMNLLSNAAHALRDRPPGHRRIRLRTSSADGRVVVRVSDSGPGIPAELRDRIFDPFVTSKAPGQGTGLGLSISYRIVEAHGGILRLEESADGGSTFAVELPSRADATALPDTGSQPANDGERAIAPGGRILLVDDDPAVRRSIAALFAHEGQHVESARDAAHALALLAAGDYDLIIADARAAVSATERFAEVLCTRHPAASERTIFLTADVREETQRWLADLCRPFFRKPFRVRDLRAVASEILRPASEGRASGR